MASLLPFSLYCLKQIESMLPRVCSVIIIIIIIIIIKEGSVENENVKLLWDTNVQCDNIIEARRPDILRVEKMEKRCSIIDIAVPADVRCSEKKGKCESRKISGPEKRNW